MAPRTVTAARKTILKAKRVVVCGGQHKGLPRRLLAGSEVDEEPRKASVRLCENGLRETRALAAAVRRKGPLPPRCWPDSVIRSARAKRAFWLPSDWGQGVKKGTRSNLIVYISPWGKMYYHKMVVEQILGRQLGPGHTLEDALEWATKQIAAGKSWRGGAAEFGTETQLVACLSKAERMHLADVSEFHFCVISARRAQDREGVARITNVEAQLRGAGVRPTWYVDAASLEAYKQLGLRAVVGGGLVEARNKALVDAARLKKACVQLSDDIRGWVYLKSGEICKDIFEGNEAAKRADHCRISPVAAARFLLARMRGSALKEKPRLGGVYPLGNSGMSMSKGEVDTEHFILGDFFVHDKSPCRFDPRMTLKEDYDFTCTHLERHGSVLRCNRLFIGAVHETNAGGAVSARDDLGEKERENIRVLQAKWPGVFMLNGKRGNGTQVVMRWSRLRRQGGDKKHCSGR